jgi:membrane protease YdiL (CAAX protease family)
MGFYPTKYALTLFPLINFVFICYVFKDEIMSYDFNKLIKNEIMYKKRINPIVMKFIKNKNPFKCRIIFYREKTDLLLGTYDFMYWTYVLVSALQAIANIIIHYTMHLQAPDISFAYGYIAAPIMSVIFSSINEEVIYRKIIFGSLDKKFNFWISSTVSSLAFMFCHYNYSAWFGYFIAGMAWSYTYKKTNNIAINIVSHIGMNLIYFTYITIK